MFIIRQLNKIAIIGGPGTGKTTLSDKLSSIYNLPIYNIDNIKFSSNWKKRDKKYIEENILNILNKDSWIIEGNYLDTFHLIISNADLIIFLDFPMILQIKGILKRFFLNFGKYKKEMKNCKEKISFSFLIKTIMFNINKRPKILKLLMKYSKCNLFILANQEQINEWINIIQKKSN